MKKRQPEVRKHKIPIPWRLYLSIGLIAFIIVGSMVYLIQQTRNISTTHDHLLMNVSKIKLKITTAHFWFEEILSGYRSENVETVREMLYQAEWLLLNLTGKEFQHSGHARPDAAPDSRKDDDYFHLTHSSHVFYIIKESLVVVQGKLYEFRDILEKRYKSGKTSGPGTEIEQNSDRIFAKFLEATDELMKKIQDSKANHLADLRAAQTFLSFICLVLAVIIAVILHRFERRKADDFLTVLRSKEALQKSEETTQALLNATSDSAILIDTEGAIIDINEIAVHRLGKIKSKVVGTDLFDMLPPDIAKERKTRADGVIRSGEPIHFEDQSESLVFNNTFYPLFDRRGKVENLAIYSRDITDQRRVEEYLHRAEQMKLVGEWALGLAQEIKNPLAGIKVSIEVLLEELAISAEDRAIVLKAVDEIKRIEVLLKSLLNFARPPKLQLTVVDVNDILDKTVAFALSQPSLLSNSSIKIKVSKDFDNTIPMTMADPMQLRQVFLNLILNAIEAMPDGGTLGVKIVYDEKAKTIQIEISDTGKGIDRGILDDVFKPFFTTKTRGSGLGLAITRRVVEQHGGVISVKSDLGKRTTFNVYLPLMTSSDKETDVISTK